MQNNRIDVVLLNPSEFNKGNKLYQTIALIKAIRDINPSILYLPTIIGLNHLIILKRLGILKCKVICWKYTHCFIGKNVLTRYLVKHFLWDGIDKLYMMYENHTKKTIELGIMDPQRCVTLSRGVEKEWYAQYILPSHTQKQFLVIATGKDSRDYETLCKACDETQTKCLILTRRHKSNVEVAKRWRQSNWCTIIFVEDLKLNHLYEYEYIMEQTGKASILAIPCKKRPYGVGYTNIIEGLPYRIPIIMTNNPDVHVNTEKEGIGYMIEPYDVESWKKHITFLKEHAEKRNRMSTNIQKMMEIEYNDQTTANYIINDMFTIAKIK